MSGSAARAWPLIVRRARPDDHPAVMAFATTTWDGWDYIPRAWPHWLAAPDGVMLVATAGRAGGRPALDADGVAIADDQPIAVARVALLSPAEAWLEGIRVDPRVRGLGVATDLQVAELRWAAASGARVIRYATGERNEASHRLGARHGFELLAAFRMWRWRERPPSGEDDDDGEDDDESASGYDDEALANATRVRQALLADMEADGYVCSADDGDAWWARLIADMTLRAGRRLCEQRGWTMQRLTRELFEIHLEQGEVLVSGDPSGRWALAILQREALPSEDVDVHLGVVAGDGELALRLVDEVRRTAQAPIRFWLPDPDPPLLDGRPGRLTALGFHPRPWSLHILARPLDGQPLPEPDHPAGLVLADEPSAMKAPLDD